MKDDYEDKSNVIRQLASMPTDKFIDHLTKTHPNVDTIAPNIAPHIFTAATNAVQFLNGKLPGAGNELIQDKSLPTSTAHKNAWLDLHDVVNDPVSVLNKVNDGTLNRHHVEALQSVYPDIHQEMINQIQEHLGQMKMSGQTLPYAKRIAIGKFIGQPLDSTMTNQNMQNIIRAASVNTGPEAQAAQKHSNSKATSAQLNQINKVTALYQTPSQAREAQASLGK